VIRRFSSIAALLSDTPRTRRDLEHLSGASSTTVARALRKLQKAGKVQKVEIPCPKQTQYRNGRRMLVGWRRIA